MSDMSSPLVGIIPYSDEKGLLLKVRYNTVIFNRCGHFCYHWHAWCCWCLRRDGWWLCSVCRHHTE